MFYHVITGKISQNHPQNQWDKRERGGKFYLPTDLEWKLSRPPLGRESRILSDFNWFRAVNLLKTRSK